jgi:hypothetical protein
MMYIELATDGDAFKTFIEKYLVPKLEPNKFVIINNINFHKKTK